MKPIGLNIKNNVGYLGKHNLCDLALKYQTPLYIIDNQQLLKNIPIRIKNNPVTK